MPSSTAPAAGKNRIGIAINTMERLEFTSRILPGLDCGGFDLIWCDGSRSSAGREFARADHFFKTPLMEIHHDVTGGPDAAIQFSLKRLLALGYDYVGLVENDIQLKPGWLPAMMSAWTAAEKDGFAVGAVTARSMAGRVLAHGPEYAVKWNVGAGMVLFSRAAAEAVLADYRLGSAKEIQKLFRATTGVDLSPVWELFMEQPDRALGADWRFASVLWQRGLIGLGTVPTLAENIDVDIREFCRTDYVRESETIWPAHCLKIEQLKSALTCWSPYAQMPGPVTADAVPAANASSEAPKAVCPACRTPSPAVIVKKTQVYHRCPTCDCIFTPAIATTVLETENHGHTLRHGQGQDAIRLQRLSKALGERPECVVDFGCGQGETTRFLQSQGLHVIGVDQDTPVQLPDLADESVDGIMMVEVIEHLYAPLEIFRQFNRILKIGGVVYAESSFADEKNLAVWEYLDPAIGHCTTHTLRSMQQIANQNGFTIAWLNPNVCCLTKTLAVNNSAPPVDSKVVGEEVASPMVTVVVSPDRSGESIRPCLENLVRQTLFDRCEIIVLDCGLAEGERAVVAEFQKQYPNFRQTRQPRATYYGGWNCGLALARGRYWISLDASVGLRVDALTILADALDRHTDCALAYADAAWTTKLNDTFPSANIVRTVKYPDYTPVEALLGGLAGSLQLFRRDALCTLGGFDAALGCAGDYEVILKMTAAHLNAVHVREVLGLFFEHPEKPGSADNHAEIERLQILGKKFATLNPANFFQVEAGNPASAASAFAALASRAEKVLTPGTNSPMELASFAGACYRRALEIDPNSETAGMNYVAFLYRVKQLEQQKADLVRRWPKMGGWIDQVSVGAPCPRPDVRHALIGPVHRPDEFSNRPTPEQLAREPKALRPWICRISGRHVHLSEELFPRPAGLRFKPEELQSAARRLMSLLAELPRFYAHFGGAGDALLLLAAFYDKSPDAVVFSHPNSIGATEALFEAFPKISKIYFLPQHTEPFFHIILRFAVYELRNCLGAGATPKDNYEEEWKAGLDLEKKYRIIKTPRWAADFRTNEHSHRIAVAPKGSLSGMVGSKRNIILPALWPAVIAHIVERGFEPVILGVSAEAKEYPALAGCVDARGESFAGQMNIIGQCAGLVGADSWAKTFSALAEIPTLVFEPIKGMDIITWKDASDWVFIEPWPSIKMIRSLEEFKQAFDARIAKTPGAVEAQISRPVIAWEGSFLDYGSLSHVNREIVTRLPGTLDVTCVGPNGLKGRTQSDPAMQQCAQNLAAKAPDRAMITVRHQWPPNWSRPASGALVVIQPWEFGALPKAWVAAADNVDEFWVPSPIVRAMYVDSGIAPEKVRVVPNGVDTKKFRPGLRPLPLPTKRKFKFLFVGGTIFRKGPDILLEAFAQAFTCTDDVCLVVKDFGGDSFYQGQTAETAIRAIQAKPDAPEIIYLKDELSSEQMPSLYAACDCLVLPYRGEGFGMPVLEAMACGLPVIVTNGGATDSFVPSDAGWQIPSRYLLLGKKVGDLPLVKNGWLLDPSKAHLVTLLQQAAAHPDECRRRGANGRARAEKRFDWNDIAATVAHRLQEMADRLPAKMAAETAPSTTTPVSVELVKPFVPPPVARIGQLDEARELLAQKNYPAAWTATDTAMARRPFHPEALVLLAEIALAAGNGKMAKRCAQRARELAPGWAPAKRFLSKPLKGDAKLDWLPSSTVPNPPSLPKLSLCLIVKNEERFLAQCLKSMRGLAAQIIVVDTGSTDRTVEIAKEFGAQIYSLPWADDFAAARNAALEHATGDWVLMLDADEELPPAQHVRLLADLKKSGVLAHRLPLVNAGQLDGRSFVPRLFRNAPGVYYFGRIHEQVFPTLVAHCKAWGLKTALGTAEILHHGYTREMVRDRNKIERNLKLLRLALAESPADVNLVMNLGLELVRSGDLAGGVEKYREAFQMMSAQPAADLVPELREVLLTQFTSQLYKLRAHAEVVEVLDSPLARVGSLSASLHLALGLAQFELKQFSEAANQMRQCLSKRKQPALSPINTDIHSAAPQHCLALCLDKLNDPTGAETAFLAALAEPGSREPVRLDFAKFLSSQNRRVDALRQLHEIVTGNPTRADAWQLGGDIALSQAELLEFARDWTGEAVRALPADAALATQHAEALLLNGDTAAALDRWGKILECDPSARTLAALILCETVESPTTHAPDEGADELAASRAFIEWYQKLIALRSPALTTRLNEQLEKLSRALPTAAQMLESALQEAELPVQV